MPIFDLISSFNGGEWSPFLDSRTNLEKYRSAARVMENFIPMPYGGVNRRPGMVYLMNAISHSHRSRLIPFNYSTSTRFVIELSNNAIQVINVGSLTKSTPTLVAPAEYYTAAMLDRVSYAQINDVIYFAHPDRRLSKLIRISDSVWRFESVDFKFPPLAEENTDVANQIAVVDHTGHSTDRRTIIFKNPPTNVNVGDLLSVVVNRTDAWLELSLNASGQTESMQVLGNVTFDTSGAWRGTVHVEKTEDGGTTWEVLRSYRSIIDRNYTSSLSFGEISTVRLRFEYASGTSSGSAKLEILNVNQPGLVKVLKAVAGQAHPGLNATYGAWNTWDSGPNPQPFWVWGNYTIQIQGGSGTGTVNVQTRPLGGSTWTTVLSLSGASLNTAGTQVLNTPAPMEARVQTGGGTSTSIVSILGGTFAPRRLGPGSWPASTDNIEEIHPAVVGRATTRWSKPAFSTSANPVAIAYHEQRVFLAGSIDRAQTIWGSRIDDFENFLTGTTDDAAVKFTLASGSQNQILWMVPQSELVVGTTGDEWVVGSTAGDKPITPTNVRAKRQSQYGSAPVAGGIMLADVIVFLQRNARKVRELTYSFERDNWVAVDLTVLAEHITRSGVRQMDFQNQADQILWAVRNDGVLAGMTYERDQNVVGWHRQTTEGTVESVAVVYGNGTEDEVWLSVRRIINGVERRFIERFQVGWRDVLDAGTLNDWCYLDSAVSIVSGFSTTVFSGLSRFSGHPVTIYARGGAGGDAVYQKTVGIGGSVTLDKSAQRVWVGLPYTSTLQPMRLSIDLDNGSSRSRKARVHSIAARLFQSRGGEVQTNDGTWRAIAPSSGVHTDEFVLSLAGNYDTTADVTIRQTQPWPLTVVSLLPRWDAYGNE